MTRKELVSDLFDIAANKAKDYGFDKVMVKYEEKTLSRLNSSWDFPLYISIESLERNKERYIQNPERLILSFYKEQNIAKGYLCLDCTDDDVFDRKNITLKFLGQNTDNSYVNTVKLTFSDIIANDDNFVHTGEYELVGASYAGKNGERYMQELKAEIEAVIEYEEDYELPFE